MGFWVKYVFSAPNNFIIHSAILEELFHSLKRCPEFSIMPQTAAAASHNDITTNWLFPFCRQQSKKFRACYRINNNVQAYAWLTRKKLIVFGQKDRGCAGVFTGTYIRYARKSSILIPAKCSAAYRQPAAFNSSACCWWRCSGKDVGGQC